MQPFQSAALNDAHTQLRQAQSFSATERTHHIYTCMIYICMATAPRSCHQDSEGGAACSCQSVLQHAALLSSDCPSEGNFWCQSAGFGPQALYTDHLNAAHCNPPTLLAGLPPFLRAVHAASVALSSCNLSWCNLRLAQLSAL